MNYITRLIRLFRISTLLTVGSKTRVTSLKKVISIILISVFFAGIFFITPAKADSVKESQTKKESETYSPDEPERVVKKEPKTSESTEEQKS